VGVESRGLCECVWGDGICVLDWADGALSTCVDELYDSSDDAAGGVLDARGAHCAV
jgi:hypothetical protein